MIEDHWKACESILEMLQYLQGRTSERKLQLFGVGCCRRMWDQMLDPRSQRAVEMVELLADGRATSAEVDAVAQEAEEAAEDLGDGPSSAVWQLMNEDVFEAALMVHEITAGWAAYVAEQTGNSEDAAEQLESTVHIVLLHDVVGDPFRPSVFDPAWRTRGETVRRLATLIYEERLFEHMPLLADALEEAGCTDEGILSHCRSGLEHIRGCWVVDAVLEKS